MAPRDVLTMRDSYPQPGHDQPHLIAGKPMTVADAIQYGEGMAALDLSIVPPLVARPNHGDDCNCARCFLIQGGWYPY